MRQKLFSSVIIVFLLVVLTGCSSSEDRFEELALEAVSLHEALISLRFEYYVEEDTKHLYWRMSAKEHILNNPSALFTASEYISLKGQEKLRKEISVLEEKLREKGFDKKIYAQYTYVVVPGSDDDINNSFFELASVKDPSGVKYVLLSDDVLFWVHIIDGSCSVIIPLHREHEYSEYSLYNVVNESHYDMNKILFSEYSNLGVYFINQDSEVKQICMEKMDDELKSYVVDKFETYKLMIPDVVSVLAENVEQLKEGKQILEDSIAAKEADKERAKKRKASDEIRKLMCDCESKSK